MQPLPIIEEQPTQGVPKLPTVQVPITQVDPQHRTLFPYPAFNPVQSACFEDAYLSNSNLVISGTLQNASRLFYASGLMRPL